jgi:hypothetical protein
LLEELHAVSFAEVIIDIDDRVIEDTLFCGLVEAIGMGK